MVSYAVSSGALNLPYVVYYGGPIMSSFILLFVSFIAYYYYYYNLKNIYCKLDIRS